MSGYLLDTNILIEWAAGRRLSHDLHPLFEDKRNRLFTSIVCVSEFMTGGTSGDVKWLIGLIRDREICMVPFEGVEQVFVVANLRRHYGLKIPDAVICAAALVRRLKLVTMDKSFAEKARDSVPVVEVEPL